MFSAACVIANSDRRDMVIGHLREFSNITSGMRIKFAFPNFIVIYIRPNREINNGNKWMIFKECITVMTHSAVSIDSIINAFAILVRIVSQ